MCRWSGKSGLSRLILVYTNLTLDISVYQQVRRARGYLDSLCMDGAEVAVNCAWNVRSCPTCWCPDDDLARTDTTYKYRRVAEVLSKLDAARDELLDEDEDTLPGCAKDVNAAEKRIRHRLLPRNAWMLVPFFELFMSCPKDELHQWYLKLS